MPPKTRITTRIIKTRPKKVKKIDLEAATKIKTAAEQAAEKIGESARPLDWPNVPAAVGAEKKNIPVKGAAKAQVDLRSAVLDEISKPQPVTSPTPVSAPVGQTKAEKPAAEKKISDKVDLIKIGQNVISQKAGSKFAAAGMSQPTPAAGAAEEEKKREAAPGKGRPLNLYRKISFSFIFLTLALLAVIFYFSFVKVNIVITPKEERTSNNLVLDIYDQSAGVVKEGGVSGAVKQVKIEQDKTYQASGARVTGEEAVGQATIINNYIKNQPLVATTRLLTADNKLFRIKDTVNVPAGGSVEVEIYADQPAADMAVAPTKFTIPGLWAGLQDKIYAETKEPIKYQQKTLKYILEEDVDNAVKNLKQILLAKAEGELKDQYKNDYNQVIYKVDDNSVSLEIDGKAGEEKDSFKAKLTANVVVVAFNDGAIKQLAKDKLISSLPQGRELVKFNEGGIVYSLNGYNTEQNTASVNATFEGEAAATTNNIIDKTILVGLTKEQLENYLANLPEVDGFEIKFSPPFISKVPNLVDSINIEIKNK